MERIASTRHTIIVISIFVILAVAGYLTNARHAGGVQPNRISLYASVAIGQLLLVRYIKVGLRVPMRTIIGSFRWFDVLIAALIFAAIRGTSLLASRVFAGTDTHTSSLLPRTAFEIALWIVISTVAGFAEELVFRGYLQRTVGLVAQAVVFGVAHGYQGIKPMIVITVIGLLFGFAARLRGSTVPGMIAHAATDIANVF